jgi:ABC-type transport system substrate-binding protein
MHKFSVLLIILISVFVSMTSLEVMAIGSPKAKKGGTFYYNLGQSPTTLNPLSSSDLYATRVQEYMVETLASRNIDTYEWEPSLATSWKTSKDGKAIDFTLREGVKWSDGKPFTAEDVKFSFDAIVEPTNKYKTAHLKPYFENIKQVSIVDKNTVRFEIKKVYFKNFDVAAGLLDILPKHVYENTSKKQIKKLNKTVIASGAYMMDKFKRGKSIILKRNPNWWGAKSKERQYEQNFKKIHLRFIKDGTIALTRAEKGDLDYLSLNAEEFVKKAKGPKWGKKVFKTKTQNKAPVPYGFIAWNLKDPLFSAKKVRKALYHLINRKLMIEKFLFGFAMPATGPLYQQSIYADPKVKAIKFDPAAALKLLREEGWKDTDGDQILDKVIDGKKRNMSFTILEPNNEFMKYLTIFKQDAQKIGVNIKLKYVEWNTFLKLLDEKKFEAVRLGWGGGSVDWDPKQIWHTDSSANKGSNFISYSNKNVDKWIDEARETVDKKKRITILRKVFKTIAEDYPYAFFFNAKYGFYAYSKRIGREKDTYEYSIGREYWWMKK